MRRTAGPDCVIDSCTSTVVGGGTLCESDTDCMSDMASSACDPGLDQCAKPCVSDSDCADTCFDGWCTSTCTNTSACETEYGVGSVCTDGHCGRTFQSEDYDGFTLNGCECPSTGPDEPRILRGRFIRNVLLCGEVPEPPPNIPEEERAPPHRTRRQAARPLSFVKKRPLAPAATSRWIRSGSRTTSST